MRRTREHRRWPHNARNEAEGTILWVSFCSLIFLSQGMFTGMNPAEVSGKLRPAGGLHGRADPNPKNNPLRRF
jgi:hypothetical protein